MLLHLQEARQVQVSKNSSALHLQSAAGSCNGWACGSHTWCFPAIALLLLCLYPPFFEPHRPSYISPSLSTTLIIYFVKCQFQSRPVFGLTHLKYSITMTQGRNVQLQVPSGTRPRHIRSTSISSIPNLPNAFLGESPISLASPIGVWPMSPITRPEVPPNTSQTLSGMATPALEATGHE